MPRSHDEILCGVALHGETSNASFRWWRDAAHAEFIAHMRTGLGGTSAGGHLLALHVAGVPIVCAVWRHQPMLMLAKLDDGILPALALLGIRTSAQR